VVVRTAGNTEAVQAGREGVTVRVGTCSGRQTSSGGHCWLRK
jgi:hypothetical protein